MAGDDRPRVDPRYCYEQYIATKILPALGDIPVRGITVEMLDGFYAELGRRGGTKGQPLAAMTVRPLP